jgi:Cu(I)/Ag(I) efflux system membrane fusion protein
MNRSLLGLGLVAALLAAAGGGYFAGQSRAPAPTGSTAAAPAPTTAAGERKPLYYRNPMGLPDTSPVPKKDEMGMDYIPVYADDAPSDAGVVKVSPERIQTLGVKTALAEEKILEATVRTVGRLEVNERGIKEVAPRFDGWIEKLYVSAVGDAVRRGQPLFSVYSPELVSAHKELDIARELAGQTRDPQAGEQAAALARASGERLKNWQMNDGGATRVDASHLRFASPADGIVLEKQAVAGMRFMAGTSMYRIADLSTVWVIADVYEQDLQRVRIGQSAHIGIDAFPDQHYKARVSFIYPTLNAATRTTQIRLELPNPGGRLRPGMFAHVDIETGGARPRLAVPSSALIDTGSRQVVLIAEEGGRFKPQPVKVGLRSGDFIEILDGLHAGQHVVVSASFLIDAESNLKAALANFSAPEKKAPTVQAVGRLDAIDGSDVTITHEPIPALNWPRMTMDFQLAKPELVKGVAPGTAIRFEFEQRGPGEFVVTRMEVGGKH